ncbi:MAG: biopolymer transporter ExbD [Planctomycetota bacterium]|nr:biopolymer transporter ExbD [Planctomycetota bacterium]
MKIGEKSRRGAHGPISLNMTSMIDATFLLLAYFIFTSVAGDQESQLMADLSVARAGTGASALSPQIIDVESDSGGAVFRIGARNIRKREELAAVLKQLPHEIGIVVRVHTGPDVAAVAAAMQAAQDAGFEKVTYVTASK